jgi:peptide/nickel transport system substrate-binding protein
VLRRVAISCLIVTLALSASARTRQHYGGTLHIETESDPWQKPDGPARRLVLDGLTVRDVNGRVQPALAAEWNSENDDHRWQFRLRPGVHFHDGSALTSVGVVASLNMACPSNCPWTSVRAAGSSVVFIGDSAMPNLPALLADNEFLITATAIADGNTPSTPIGTGPFQFISLTNGVLTLTANESCWQGRPFIDTIEMRVHRAVHDQWLDLSVGRADVVEVPAEQLRLAQQQRLTMVVSRPVSLLELQIVGTGALANPMLRASIAQAVDRDTLYNVIFQKQGAVTASLLPQSLTGYSFLFPVDRNLSKAHELRGGLTLPLLTLSANSGATMQLAAQRLALNLHEAGFNVQVTDAQHSDMVLRTLPLEGDEPAAVWAVLLRSAGQVAPAVEPSSASLYKVEHEVLDAHMLIPLLDLPRAYAISGRVRDLHLRADGMLDLAQASLEDSP